MFQLDTIINDLSRMKTFYGDVPFTRDNTLIGIGGTGDKMLETIVDLFYFQEPLRHVQRIACFSSYSGVLLWGNEYHCP